MTLGVISAVCWFLLFLTLKVVLFHWKYVENCFSLIIRIFFGCVAGHIVTVLLLNSQSLNRAPTWAVLVYGFVVLGCLFILYMPFYYNVVNSLSIQTLVLLGNSPDKTLPLAELRHRFAGPPIVTGRLDTMVANHYLENRNGRYGVTKKGRMVARLFGGLKDFWKMGPGG
ncbi:MAG TPA: hypothetical protein VG273_20740 [Bryobacteraceae bacterium]|jgi:hypothetical protein|nr:hypothetical protein [Bryobacteraceae bacterium]